MVASLGQNPYLGTPTIGFLRAVNTSGKSTQFDEALRNQAQSDFSQFSSTYNLVPLPLELDPYDETQINKVGMLHYKCDYFFQSRYSSSGRFVEMNFFIRDENNKILASRTAQASRTSVGGLLSGVKSWNPFAASKEKDSAEELQKQIARDRSFYNMAESLANQTSPVQNTPTLVFDKDPPFYIEGDEIKLDVHSQIDGFLSIYELDQLGNFNLLIPNPGLGQFPIRAGEKASIFPMMIHGKSQHAIVHSPYGKSILVALVTTEPLDWRSMMKVRRRGESWVTTDQSITDMRMIQSDLTKTSWGVKSVELLTRAKAPR